MGGSLAGRRGVLLNPAPAGRERRSALAQPGRRAMGPGPVCFRGFLQPGQPRRGGVPGIDVRSAGRGRAVVPAVRRKTSARQNQGPTQRRPGRMAQPFMEPAPWLKILRLQRVACGALRGKVTRAHRPPSGRLFSTMSPPCWRAMLRAMARPRPLPPVLRLRDGSSR